MLFVCNTRTIIENGVFSAFGCNVCAFLSFVVILYKRGKYAPKKLAFVRGAAARFIYPLCAFFCFSFVLLLFFRSSPLRFRLFLVFVFGIFFFSFLVFGCCFSIALAFSFSLLVLFVFVSLSFSLCLCVVISFPLFVGFLTLLFYIVVRCFLYI